MVVDTKWRFVYLNRQAQTVLGKSPDEILGSSVWASGTELFGPEAEAHYREALAGQAPVHFELAVPGSRNYYEIHAYPTPEGLTIYGHDFTRRHHVEQALRETESLFRAFMDNNPALAWMKDSQFRFLYFNRASEEIARERGVDYQGRTDFDLWPPEIAAPIRADDQVVLDENRCLQFVESTLDTMGQMRHWQVSKFPFRDGAGRLYVGGTAVEITEQRRAAARLQALSRRLLEVQELERRALARELHDEVGHLLTSVHLTVERVRTSATGDTLQRLEQAQGVLRQVMALVRELTLRLRPAVLDELGLIPALAWHFGRFTTQTGIHVRYHRPEQDLTLSPEVAIAAFRIIQEALTNVARHAKVQEVEVSVSADEKTLRLEIRDRGAGFVAGSSLGTAGLSGMQERAALLGGRLVFDAQVGKGTVVTAELPVEKAEQGSEGAPG
jgi:PAS domain S-box-containing protein